MSPIRILLADDHAVTREGMRRLLEAEPDMVVVGEAADGEAAVRLAQAVRPDILLLDIKMAGLDGIQVARRLGQQLPATRIVVLTGYDDAQYAPALARLGVQGYLSKTASAREVVSAIRAVHAGQVAFPPAVAELFGSGTPPATTPAPTVRELEVVRLVAQGHANRAIAQALGMSERTVQFHLHNLFTKLRASSRTELVYRARRQGWLP